MGIRLKKVKLNGIPIRQICADCKKEFTEYKWSPFWCPECDAKRIDRILNFLDTKIQKMGSV